MKNPLLLLAIPLLLQACATVNHSSNQSSKSSYVLRYGFYSYSYHKIENYKYENGLNLIFPSIPGAIFGNPTSDILAVSPVSSDYTFRLNIPNNLEKKAKRLSDNRLEIVPSNTKVLRLGTFHLSLSHQDQIGGGGFINTESGDFLILMYFSNPAEVKGTVKVGNDWYDHQISISKPGWSWIKLSELSANTYQLSVFSGDLSTIEFCVLVENLINT